MSITINKAWETLFLRHNILDEVNTTGVFKISAKEINTVKEARLMAKFDRSALLPDVFLKNKLSILPTKRGEYIIGSFNTHAPVTYTNSKPIFVQDPQLETLEFTNLYSEASALLFAYNSGIIADFLGAEKVNYTVNGRMSSGIFDYSIQDIENSKKTYNISVNNAQIEIDAGYETPDLFCLCEAKNIASEEILVRQIYYPYRLWSGKVSKPIIPVFMVFSNDVFHLFRYSFEEKLEYNSMILKEQKSYTLVDEDIELNEIVDLCDSIKSIIEPQKIAFPQANSFARIVDLLSILYEKELTREEVAIQYEFVDRQTNYYISACEYLGLIDRDKNHNSERIYRLNAKAKSIMQMRHKQKYLQLVQCVLEKPIFNKVFRISLDYGEIPPENEICKIMKESNLTINDTTIKRRSSTVRGWIEWVLEQGVTD